MPLSKVEREALEVVREQHAETRMGTPTHIVHAGMNAKTSERRGRITDVLIAMRRRGLLIDGPRGWVPTNEAALALDGTDEITGDGTGEALAPIDECHATVERVGSPFDADLLNRCAAMHSALLAQALQAYARGDAGALAELQWLRDTERQLVAAGGEW